MNLEYLIVLGHIDHAGRFKMRRAYSTPVVRRWPEAQSSRLWIQLHDSRGQVLRREAALAERKVCCVADQPPREHVMAAIALLAEATEVRLVNDGRPIWTYRIPPFPKLRVSAKPTGSRRVQLATNYSPPGDGAWMAVAFTWGPRRVRVIYRGKPKREIAVDLNRMPGGRQCQLLVSYSNGLRSARAASRRFAISPLGSSLTIVTPAQRQVLTAGVPVTLQAALVDDENPAGAQFDALVWFIDGVQVGTGLLTSVERLKPGRHEIAVEYRVNTGATARIQVQAKAPEVPCAHEWLAWDFVSGNT